MNTNSKGGRTNDQARLASGACGRRVGSLPGFLRLVALAGLLLLSSACNSTTVFQADFNSDTVGQPPASTQTVGTVSLDPVDGTVVVERPSLDLPANQKWVRIGYPAPSPAAMRGDFSRFYGVGNYTLEATLFIAGGTGTVTVQFEPFGEGPTSYLNFLHLDFMPEGDVQIDDGPRFGHFPKDKTFLLTVNLVITQAHARAHITLFGEDASGSTDVSVKPESLPVALKFGAVRFWLGFRQVGQFFVDDILVTRRNS